MAKGISPTVQWREKRTKVERSTTRGNGATHGKGAIYRVVSTHNLGYSKQSLPAQPVPEQRVPEQTSTARSIDRVIALVEEWVAEPTTAEDDATWERVKASIDSERRELGMRTLFDE